MTRDLLAAIRRLDPLDAIIGIPAIAAIVWGLFALPWLLIPASG